MPGSIRILLVSICLMTWGATWAAESKLQGDLPPEGVLTLPRPDELGALLLENGCQRGGPGPYHEVAEMAVDEVLEPERKLRVSLLSGDLAEHDADRGAGGFRGEGLPGCVLH